jgi:monoamine oxidase
MLDIAIVGGGLAGLSLAQRLIQEDRNVAVFEARARFGGRIVSLPAGEGFHYDLGPSWIWPGYQPRLAGMIANGGLGVFPQWLSGHSLYQTARELPPQAYVDHSTYEPARRLQGGSYRLVETLLQQLPSQSLYLNHHLRQVIDRGDYVELQFNRHPTTFSVPARRVVVTIPPRLLVNTVAFTPALDGRLQALMKDTPTWMAGHAKALIRYERPFWREANLSGSALASYPGAALAEIFDAGSPDGDHAALGGFVALPAALRARYRGDLEALVLEQLVRLFGKEAARPQAITIKDWFTAPLTATPADEVPPVGHPQYGHAWLQLDHWNDKLYFGGTETAAQFGGYLEGALEAAERVAKSLLM